MFGKGLDIRKRDEHIILARFLFGVVRREHFGKVAYLHGAVGGVWRVSEHNVSRLNGRVAASFAATDDPGPNISG